MKNLVTAFFTLISFSLSAQTLFYYGNDSVSVKDFLAAYHKNNTGTKSEKALRDYLDLYITSRLKIKEAKERGYDTLPQMVSDLESLRQQILPNYLNDKESVNKLVDEAFTRSQKDLHIAHIFISFTQNGVIDSLPALKKLSQVQAKLKSNTDFAAVAKQYSDDPSAKTNGGDLGYITVFTLPYELENLAYSTPVGQISKVYKSKAGYHIFKNLGERKDPGRIKALQILLAFPPDADQGTKSKVKKLADSLYNRLLKGDDFGRLATSFSNDVISASASGQIPDFGVGQYDPAFENVVYALKPGSVSKPFLTSHGYHIVKCISKVPTPTDKNDKKAMQALRQRVEQSDRMNTTRTALAHKILKEADYKKASFDDNDLWIYSDSVLNYTAGGSPSNLTPTSALFNLGDKTVTVADWISYAQTFRYKSDGSGVKPYPQIWDEFLEAMAIDYYQNHLENFNEEFRQQITEFKEGNLFFEIMQRQVWGPAQNDSAALYDFYQKNKGKYNWNKSADAVIFYANNAAMAKTFSDQLRKAPSNWHNLVTDFSEKVAADSSRFDLAQIPNPTNLPLKQGIVTTPLVNKADNTASFAYILRIHDQPEPRSFADAKGLVINDYQNELEKNWVSELKKTYPVKINENVLNELIKDKKY